MEGRNDFYRWKSFGFNIEINVNKQIRNEGALGYDILYHKDSHPRYCVSRFFYFNTLTNIPIGGIMSL